MPAIEQSILQKTTAAATCFSDILKNDARLWGASSGEAFSDLMSSIQPLVTAERGFGQNALQERACLKERGAKNCPMEDRQQNEDNKTSTHKSDVKMDDQGQTKKATTSLHDKHLIKDQKHDQKAVEKGDKADNVNSQSNEEDDNTIALKAENMQAVVSQRSPGQGNDLEECLKEGEAKSVEEDDQTEIFQAAIDEDKTQTQTQTDALSSIGGDAERKNDEGTLYATQSGLVAPIQYGVKESSKTKVSIGQEKFDVPKPLLAENQNISSGSPIVEEDPNGILAEHQQEIGKENSTKQAELSIELGSSNGDMWQDDFEIFAHNLRKGAEKSQSESTVMANGVGQTKTTNVVSQGTTANLGASQHVVGAAVSARPTGLYNHASQLSAVRVASGGAVGLPHVIEQVSVQLHKAAVDGQREVVINLKPAELGKIEVKLEITVDNKVTGTVSAENQAVLNLLQKDSAGLHRALQEAGLQTDPGCLQFSLKEENGNSQFAHQNKTGRNETYGFVSDDTNDGPTGDDVKDALGVQYLVPGRVNLRV